MNYFGAALIVAGMYRVLHVILSKNLKMMRCL